MFDTFTRLLDALVVHVRHARGEPIAVQRMIDQHGELVVDVEVPRRTIALTDVPRWHEFEYLLRIDDWSSSNPKLRGRVPRRGGGMEYVEVERPEYSELGRQIKIDGWCCDIQDVEGFGASKSELSHFTSLDAMVRTNSPEMIDEITPAKLAKNLAHKEIRLIHQENTSDCFISHDWDGRLFLSNSGGSHHFAAARLIAKQLGTPVPLRGRLYRRGVNLAPAASLVRDYAMFAVADDDSVMDAFSEAMENYRASWFFHHLPRQLGQARAVLLPREDGRATRVAQLLRAAGAFDFGRLLTGLATPGGAAVWARCHR